MFVSFIKELCNKETSSEWISSFTVTLQMRTANVQLYHMKEPAVFWLSREFVGQPKINPITPRVNHFVMLWVLISKSVYETLMKVHSF